MINYQPLRLQDKPQYDALLTASGQRGCEYSFANLYLWGRQRGALVAGNLTLFSQFNRRSVYPFPVGPEDKGPVLDAIIHDAQARGIPCRLTGLTDADQAFLQQRYPGRFRIHADRDSFDYVYDIHALADLRGRSYQKKRNHIHKFHQSFPHAQALPLTRELVGPVEQMLESWYAQRLAADPQADFHMERSALKKALKAYEALEMEGLVLMDAGRILAFTLGSRLDAATFDIHFEKALPDADGAYPAINQAFARYLRERHPELLWLNREDDMGIEGLRKAKLSYYPHHMVEKHWACLLEDGYEY